MRERLRKVADEPLRDGVVLLREQAEVVAKVEQRMEEGLGLLSPALERQHLDEPERAGEEGSLARWKAVDVDVLAPPEVVLRQRLLL